MTLNGHEVFLHDEGTLDTVLTVDGCRHSYDQEFAAPFREDQHPRANDGKFGDKIGAGTRAARGSIVGCGGCAAACELVRDGPSYGCIGELAAKLEDAQREFPKPEFEISLGHGVAQSKIEISEKCPEDAFAVCRAGRI